MTGWKPIPRRIPLEPAESPTCNEAIVCLTTPGAGAHSDFRLWRFGRHAGPTSSRSRYRIEAAGPPGYRQKSSIRDENKSEPPPRGQGDKADAAPVVESSPAGETAKSPSNPTESSASTKSAAPARSNEVHKISFDDLNCGMQADIVFRPWMITERVKELDGQQVRIVGYMNPDVKQHGITEFILLRNTECKFGPSGQADHLIRVKLDPGVTTNFSSKPVQVVGKLIVNPFNGPDGKTWCIFDMTGKSVGVPQR